MNFICYNFGNKYHNAYVDALYHMIFRYNKIDQFICVTDRKRNINKRIDQLIIKDNEYEGAWVKLHSFQDNELPYDYICLDLDIVIQKQFSFNKLREVIADRSLLFINPKWGDNDPLFRRINQLTYINSSVMYINKHLEAFEKLKFEVTNDEWCKYYSMDRFIYNTLSKREIKYFDSLSVYSYYDQAQPQCEQPNKHICLLNKSDGYFFNQLISDHWIFKYYPIHLSYPSTYHID